MGVRASVSAKLRKQTKERDDYKCVKCGRYKNLEIHHIYPCYLGGQDVLSNLVTLCHACHKIAPDDPVDFFKWAARHLPPDIEKCRDFGKMLIRLVIYKKPELLKTNKSQELDDFIDDFVQDFWKVMVSNEINELSRLLSKYDTQKEYEDFLMKDE